MDSKWVIDISTGNNVPMIAKIAIAKLNENDGVNYEPVAYLGSKDNKDSIDYAIVLKQNLVVEKDTVENVVLIIFTVAKEEITEVEISNIVESNLETHVSVEFKNEMNKTAQELFDQRFAGFVGTINDAIAFLGSRSIRDNSEYIYLAEQYPVIDTPEEEVKEEDKKEDSKKKAKKPAKKRAEGAEGRKIVLITIDDKEGSDIIVDIIV